MTSLLRPHYPEARVHATVREVISQFQRDVIEEVSRAIDVHDVVVVGMTQNPHPRRAQRLLERKGIAHHVLTYGSYFSQWRRRLALKMWTGWPTFPMVFVKGVLIGGADDLARLDASGELARLLGAPRTDVLRSGAHKAASHGSA